MGNSVPKFEQGPAEPAPASELDALRASLSSLEEQVSRLGLSIGEQESVFERLKQVSAKGDSTEQARILAQAGTQLMMFQMLCEQISGSFDALGQPIETLVDANPADDSEQLSALSEIADALASSLDPSEVLYQAMDSLVALTGAERAFLMMKDTETGEMSIELSRNFEEDTLSGTSFDVSRTIVNAVVRDGTPILTTNAAADPRFSAEHSIAVHSLRSIACVPLKTNEDVIGVIYAEHRIKTSQFSQTDIAYLAAFANQASTAIQNARLFESVSVARNLMKNVFESITSGVITTDLNGVVTLFNRAAENILKIEADECMELPSFLVLPVLGGIIPDVIDQVLGGDGSVITTETEGEIGGRGKVKVKLTAGRITDAPGDTQGVAVLIEGRTESMRFHKERELVTRYLPRQLVDTFSDLGDLQLGGAREVVSIFFADIRGFTGFSETHDPKQIVDVINAYFGIASNLVQQNQGIVDKYMGDAVMAHYNSPLLSLDDHAWHAVKTAWETKLQVEAFLATQRGNLSLEFGIGVNTGEALAGNVGASTRMEYTLIGDAVNVAKRLQEIARPGQILIGENTYQQVRTRVEVKRTDGARLKGRDAAENVYEVVGLSS